MQKIEKSPQGGGETVNPVRVLFLIDGLVGGGAEAVLRNLVNHMDSEKFAITVQTRSCMPPDRWLKPHIRYRAMKSRWLRLWLWLGWAYPLYVRERHDVEIAFLECFPTKLLAQSGNPDAVKLAWVHCDLEKKKLRPSYFSCYRAFDRVVCVGKAVGDAFARLTGREADILENVLDEEEILEKSRAFQPDQYDHFTFAAVGRLSREKGFDRLLTAARRLEAEGFSFALLLLGDGPERRDLERIAGENVVFLGFQENPYPYMAAADAMLLPSRTEGSSTVAAEAMILGKSMAVTNCPGMEDLVQDCALLMENTTEGIYEGMKRLLTDAALRTHLAEAAQERSRSFSKEQTVRQVEDYILQALEEKRGAPWKFT